jgi:hypothetical protein
LCRNSGRLVREQVEPQLTLRTCCWWSYRHLEKFVQTFARLTLRVAVSWPDDYCMPDSHYKLHDRRSHYIFHRLGKCLVAALLPTLRSKSRSQLTVMPDHVLDQPVGLLELTLLLAHFVSSSWVLIDSWLSSTVHRHCKSSRRSVNAAIVVSVWYRSCWNCQ